MSTNQSDALATPQSTGNQMLSNSVYDFLNKLVVLVLPALGTFYFTLASIWGLPYGEQIVGTITALALFLGVIVKLSNKSYNASDAKYNGEVLVTGDPKNPHSLVFNAPLSEMENQAQIVLKVSKSIGL